MGLSFIEYTDQRVSDWENIFSYLPEHKSDTEHLRKAYENPVYVKHMENIKRSIEKILGRETSWAENDMYFNAIGTMIITKEIRQEIYLEARESDLVVDGMSHRVESELEMTRRLCVALGCPMDIDLQREMIASQYIKED